MMQRLVMGLALFFAAVAAQGDVVVVDQYRIANVLHFILRNEGAAPAEIGPRGIVRADGFTSPLWWSAAYPETLAPGVLGRVSLGLRRNDTLQGEYSLRLAGGELAVSLSPDDARGLRVLRHVSFPDTATAAVIVENDGADACAVDAVSVGDQPELLDALRSDAEMLPCESGVLMLCGTMPRGDSASLLVGLLSNGQWRYRHAYAFNAPSFRVLVAEAEEGYICPTHRHGPWSRVAAELLHLEPQLPVHFCRNQAPEGMAVLSQITPRAVVNPQGSNLRRGTPEAWEGLRAFAAFAVRAAAPGQLEALIESNSNFDGAYPQPTEADTDTMTPRDLQYTVFAALASGCSGLRLRFGEHTPPGYREFAENLRKSLDAESGRLQVAVPVTQRASCSAPDVAVFPLFTSPNDLLLILLRRAPVDAAINCEVSLDRPSWFVPRAVHVLAGPAPEELDLKASGRIRVHFETVRDLAAAFISAE